MKNKKRVLSLILACCMTAASIQTAFAVEKIETDADGRIECTALKQGKAELDVDIGVNEKAAGVVGSGTFSSNKSINWKLTNDGTLTITGKGKLPSASWDEAAVPIKKIVIGKGITRINNYAFNSITSLVSVSMSDTVTEIGAYSFSDCSGLTFISLPASVSKIERAAFKGCTGLISISLPDSLTDIGMEAFEECRNLRSISIPDNVSSLGQSAFQDCTSLTSVNIGKKVTTISASLFQDCSSLRSLKIPDTVKILGVNCFQNCTSLSTLDLGNGVTTIDSDAFFDCVGLTNVSIPDSVQKIGRSAFYGCAGIRTITLGKGLKMIEHSVFRGCKTISSIIIPATVSSIADCAFTECTSLKMVKFIGNKPEIERHAFLNTETTIYYPSNNSTWDSVIINHYGGSLTWKTWTPTVADIFSDVSSSSWYVPFVQYAYDTGLMSGISDTRFAPNTTLTRAEMAQILYNRAGKPAVTDTSAFTDVKEDAWYNDAILWAVQNNIVSGVGNGKFAPEEKVTREQLAVMLYNCENKLPVSGSLNGFEDDAAVSNWAKDAMLWATQSGIISGSKNGDKLYLNPTKNASRAETATMMMQYLEK